MAFSMYDASVPICAQQLGALATIIDKTAALYAEMYERLTGQPF